MISQDMSLTELASVVSEALEMADVGRLRIITPTHSVMDRLIAAVVWSEPQSLEQAVLVAREQSENIDWSALRRWLKKEGIETAPEVRLFLERTDTI